MENDESNAIVEQMKTQMKFVKARSRVGLIIMFFLLAFFGQSMWESHKSSAEYEVSCENVLDCLDQGKAERALQIAQQIIKTSPDCYYAHSCLADAYLANGDVTNALKHAAIAFEFYPSEVMKKELLVIQMRIENEASM